MLKVVPAFVILYGLMQSFGNLGPGSVLGLASAESYATAVRGTCYGFSAAIGKVGAVVGTQTFTPIRDNLGPRWTFVRQVPRSSRLTEAQPADELRLSTDCRGSLRRRWRPRHLLLRAQRVRRSLFLSSLPHRLPTLTIRLRSLNGDLADEDVKFAAFLKSRGWDGTMGVQGKEALIDREEVAGLSEGKAEE